MSRESKAARSRRLKESGQLEAFKAEVSALREGGKEQGEAERIAATRYGPRQVDDDDVADASVAKVDWETCWEGKPGASMVDAVEWAFEHIDHPGVGPEDSVSPGAWSMLLHARSSAEAQGEFYRWYVARSLPTKQELETESRRSKASEEVLEQIGRQLEQAASAVLQQRPEGYGG